GVNGTTSRHSMRLVNSRFSVERKFLWDESAADLEDQTARPIEDHIEMGFSGRNGIQDFDDMIRRISQERYYKQLFTLAYGDSDISRKRISEALAQFIRSIQSFDSRFDAGFRQVNDLSAPFPNFTDLENLGKSIFLLPNSGAGAIGAGCQGCHFAPEFDIDPDSRNNGVIGVVGSASAVDIQVTRAPTLRDLFNRRGQLNGPLMHSGEFATLESVIDHYNEIPDDPRNTNLDARLRVGGQIQQLFLTADEKEAIVAFLKTLTGSSIYTNPKYADPFAGSGD
ncbi:MAG: cytochrome c peroxidase, partial [Bacteroidota bacterium]